MNNETDLILIKNNQVWDKHTTFNYIYITENNDVVCSFSLHLNEQDYLNNSNFYLHSFYVQPEYIGNGYGNMMMDEVIKLTKNVNYVWLKIRNDNTIAIDLYKKFGFKFWCTDNEDDKYHFMIKE